MAASQLETAVRRHFPHLVLLRRKVLGQPGGCLPLAMLKCKPAAAATLCTHCFDLLSPLSTRMPCHKYNAASGNAACRYRPSTNPTGTSCSHPHRCCMCHRLPLQVSRSTWLAATATTLCGVRTGSPHVTARTRTRWWADNAIAVLGMAHVVGQDVCSCVSCMCAGSCKIEMWCATVRCSH